RNDLRTHSKDIVAFLAKHTNINAEQAKFPGWENIQGTSIVGVNSNGKGYHWVIVIKNDSKFVIIDPADAQVYQGIMWINDAEEGFVATSQSAFVILKNFTATHIQI
ncbi:MAG: hypothetical protein WA003_05750, partial [Desulfuromonadaceae bacterium]